MLRIAALLGFALMVTMVGGFMTLDTDMEASQVVGYVGDSN